MKLNRLGWPLVVILSLIPALLWLISPYADKAVTSPKTLLFAIGQVTALVGTVMCAITLILSARLHAFEKIFPGLNKVYERHNLLGQIGFVLLIIHPLSLLPSYAKTLQEAVDFLTLSQNLAINLGIISLGIMIVLIVLTLYLRPKYNLWKLSHKLFGIAFAIAAIHIWLIPSTTSQDLILKIYIFAFVALGLSAYFYRTILGFFFIKTYNYSIENVTKISSSVTQIRLSPLSQKIQFTEGQFIFISFKSTALGSEFHPFSISSAPGNGLIEITVKNLGDYTEKLSNLSSGTKAKIEGPFGIFSFKNKSSKQIWIAGGIGITPFLSMARSLKKDDSYQVDIYYCVQDESEAVLQEELKSCESSSSGRLKLILHPSKTCGRISAEIIEKTSQGLNGKDILMCAPPAMINSLKKQFADKGVPAYHIHSEEFNF
jgi:predicted ferric reductase